MFKLSRIRAQDWFLTALVIATCIFGILLMISTTFFPKKEISSEVWQQLLFMIIGFIGYLGLTSIDFQVFKRGYVITLLWLGTMGMLFLAWLTSTTYPRRWINLGAFSIQPSELAKIVVILITAYLFWRMEKKLPVKTLFRQIVFHLLAITSIILVVVNQPSLGNGVMLALIWASLWLSTVNSPVIPILILGGGLFGVWFGNLTDFGGWLAAVAVVSIVVFTLFFFRYRRLAFVLPFIVLAGFALAQGGNWLWATQLTGYQQQRILSFLNPENDPLGTQWQSSQALLTIQSAGLTGKGYMHSGQINNNLVPFSYTDFAYTAVIAQFGSVGGAIVLIMLSAIVWRCMYIANLSKDNLSRTICIGVGMLVGIHTIVHVAINLNYLPVTGIPLPLISYGGSLIITVLLALGLVQSVVANQSEDLVPTWNFPQLWKPAKWMQSKLGSTSRNVLK